MAIENRGPELQAVCYTLITAATIAISLRVYVRTCIVKNFGIDDYLMVFAYIFFSLFVSFALVGVHYGTGRHRADLDAEDFKKAMMYWWYCYLWYCLSMITSKISIGYFLLRITVRRIDIFLVYGTMCITVLTGAIFFFVTLLQCRPISFFWNRDQEGSCINVEVIIALTYLYSVFSVISDFTCAILPMFLVWKLNMDRRSKIALIPIMAMACVASSAVVVRFPFVKDFRNPDFLWATLDIALWSTTEQGLAVTAGSLATLRPLLRILAAKFGTLTTNKSGLQSSDQLGSGYRGQPKSGGSQPRSRGPFSLTTFMRGDDDGYRIEDEEESRSGKFRNDLHDKSWTRDVVSEWPSRGGGSDEELTGPSRETRSKSIKVTTSIRQEEHKI